MSKSHRDHMLSTTAWKCFCWTAEVKDTNLSRTFKINHDENNTHVLFLVFHNYSENNFFTAYLITLLTTQRNI